MAKHIVARTEVLDPHRNTVADTASLSDNDRSHRLWFQLCLHKDGFAGSVDMDIVKRTTAVGGGDVCVMARVRDSDAVAQTVQGHVGQG
eukprot:363302-Chlamydomonas_euryale.AAC.6